MVYDIHTKLITFLNFKLGYAVDLHYAKSGGHNGGLYLFGGRQEVIVQHLG